MKVFAWLRRIFGIDGLHELFQYQEGGNPSDTPSVKGKQTQVFARHFPETWDGSIGCADIFVEAKDYFIWTG
jgi:hypothetical protein